MEPSGAPYGSYNIPALDSIGGIYRPLITKKPELSIYFVCFLLIASIAMMNLVTGIMVECAMKLTLEYHEMRHEIELARKRDLVKQLRKMFAELDADGSGEVELAEIRNAPPHVQETLGDVVDMDELEDLFQTIDTDGSGSIGIDEFCEGMVKATGNRPMELHCIMRQCRAIMAQNGQLLERLGVR